MRARVHSMGPSDGCVRELPDEPEPGAEPLPRPSPQIQQIPIGRVIPTPDNPRRFLDNDPHLAELAASIRQFGILQPLLARPHPIQVGAFDLRAGERRLRAAVMVELVTVPVIVREMSDEEALEVTVLENLQRENLHPLEEAKGVALLLERRGWNQAEVAAHLGKSERWVARRAAIARLSPAWRKEFLDPTSPVAGWSAAHMEAIAAYPVEVQDSYLAQFRDDDEPSKWDRWAEEELEGTTSSDVEIALMRDMHLLSSAPWDLDDAELDPAAGPCSVCPQRDDRQLLLFDEVDPKNVHCLNSICWATKTRVFTAGAIARARAENPKVIPISRQIHSLDDDLVDEQKIEPDYDYRKCGQTARGAIPVVAIDGKDAGQVTWATRVGNGSSGSGNRKAGAGPKSLAERREGHERSRGKEVCRRVEELLKPFLAYQYREDRRDDCESTGSVQRAGGKAKCVFAPLPALPLHTVVALAATFGTSNQHRTVGGYGDTDGVRWKQVDEMLSTEAQGRISERLLIGVLPILFDRIHTGVMYAPAPPVAEAERVCGLFGWDFQGIVEEVRLDKPEPKAWKKLEAEEKAKAEAKAKRKKSEPKAKVEKAKSSKGKKGARSKPAPAAPTSDPAADIEVKSMPYYYKGKKAEASISLSNEGKAFFHAIMWKFHEAGVGPLVLDEDYQIDTPFESARAALEGAVARFERQMEPAALKLAGASKSKQGECQRMLDWARGLLA